MTDRVEITRLETIRENMRNFHPTGVRTFIAPAGAMEGTFSLPCQRRENVASAIRLRPRCCYAIAEFVQLANFDRAVIRRGCLKCPERLMPAV